MDTEKASAFGKALSRAMFYCSKAEHCPAEVFDKLCQWEIEEEFWEDIVSILIEENYISEKRYARAYCLDKLRYNKWGKQKIAFQLRGKKINRSIIDLSLSEIDDLEYCRIIDREITKKHSATKEPDAYKMRAKLTNFALSRGYDMELCNPVIDHLLSKQ